MQTILGFAGMKKERKKERGRRAFATRLFFANTNDFSVMGGRRLLKKKTSQTDTGIVRRYSFLGCRPKKYIFFCQNFLGFGTRCGCCKIENVCASWSVKTVAWWIQSLTIAVERFSSIAQCNTTRLFLVLICGAGIINSWISFSTIVAGMAGFCKCFLMTIVPSIILWTRSVISW